VVRVKTYIISYDLVGSRRYDSLYEELKSFKTWAKITESTWAITTDLSAVEVRDRLSAVLDSNDRLFVVKSGVEAAWSNVICKNEWLKKWL
jgi:hypothetical protein